MILELLATRGTIEVEVAKKLEFSRAPTGHHAKELDREGLARIAKKERESLG